MIPESIWIVAPRRTTVFRAIYASFYYIICSNNVLLLPIHVKTKSRAKRRVLLAQGVCGRLVHVPGKIVRHVPRTWCTVWVTRRFVYPTCFRTQCTRHAVSTSLGSYLFLFTAGVKPGNVFLGPLSLLDENPFASRISRF